MPGISTTYLLPAIVLNPAFILHLINTFVSHAWPPPPTISYSPHPIMESLGPVPGAKLYFDMHASEHLCWRYTAIMVIVQVCAFGKVSNNRMARRDARAAKQARRQEELERLADQAVLPRNSAGFMGDFDGANDEPDVKVMNGNANGNGNGKARKATNGVQANGFPPATNEYNDDDDSVAGTETSEEMMI